MKVLSALHRRHAIAGSALERCATAIQQIGAGRWSLALSNGALVPVCAEATEDWLTLDAPVVVGDPDEGRPTAWDLLSVNARLSGACRIARPVGARALRLRADIPLDEDVDLPARVRQACEALVHASHGIDGHGGLEPAGGEPGEHEVIADLAGLCRAAGWAFSERDDGRVLVDLGGAGEPASVERRSNGDVQASVPVLEHEGLAPVCREALGSFLLAASGIVRLARAAADDGDDGTAARFEVRYRPPVEPIEMAHALSALSVACAWFGREAQALADERVARLYLAVSTCNGAEK